MTAPPIVLTIAGSDSSGGAGIQADLKTFTMLGVYGATVLTALTAQNTTGVKSVHSVPAQFIKDQIEAVTTDLDVAALKIGMLGTRTAAQTIAECLTATKIPHVVVDPVMKATSGDPLIDDDAIETLKTKLFPLSNLITPNRAEAALLTGRPPFNTYEEMQSQAKSLLDYGCGAVLLKGGHAKPGSRIAQTAIDCLVTNRKTTMFERPRLPTQNTHGTGCTLSAAIAAYLARGQHLVDAVESAKEYVWQAIASAANTKVGNGNGPIDHMFARDMKNN